MTPQKVYTILISITCLFLLSCSKSSTEKLNEVITEAGRLQFSGSFTGIGNEQVSGQAKIFRVNNQYQLKLENFSTDNGPDLKVYLSKSDRPDAFISLGAIKSTMGNQVYVISGMPDFAIYKYVLIHCERYNHLFGRAELK